MKRARGKTFISRILHPAGAPAPAAPAASKLANSTSATLLRRLAFALMAGAWLAAQAAVFTNDTLLSPFNAAYDGQDVVVSNCVLTVDGPHSFASLRVANGATLTHSSATNGVVSITASVVNEPQVLAGTNPVSLLSSNVVASSVVVKDASGVLTYTQALDYSLGSSNQFTTVQRAASSAIPDGAGVLVSYDYAVGATNSGLNLALTGDLEIEAGALIDVKGRGYGGNYAGRGFSAGTPATGGGGGHGGFGGISSSNADGGLAYDAVFQPVNLGSSGGSGSTGVGGAGGALYATIGGTAKINGTISANGADGVNSRSGGGSGGGIWLSAQTLSGSGVISADGGAGESGYGGGGGGGRVALYFATNQFSGSVLVRGGSGFVGGGAGTLYRQAADLSQMQVVVDNGGRLGTNTPVQVTNGADLLITGAALASPSGSQAIGTLSIASGSALTPPGPQQLVMVTASNVTVQAGAGIVLDSAGYPAGAGTGNAGSYTSGGTTWGSGAGHGGEGGWGGGVRYVSGGGWNFPRTDFPGTYYGSATSPSTFGSGGGGNTAQGIYDVGTPLGGAGGGALGLIVSGALLLEGTISANGGSGIALGGGGGSGGSLRLMVGTLSGSGSISANGGNGRFPNAGGGSGGRIAIAFATNLFTGSLSAYGGNGTNQGGAGTVYLKPTGQNGTLLLDNAGLTNAGLSGALTPVSPSGTDALTIQGAARGQLDGPVSVSALLVRSNCSLVSTPAGLGSVVVNGDASIEQGASLSANGFGALPGYGTGFGQSAGACGGGAGHGGYGATGTNSVALGGTTYGWYNTPTNTGSGGGGALSIGGFGGGALRLTVSGALTLGGTISADAAPAYGVGGGGGSGGSVWLTVAQLFGAGLISANGGNGWASSGGGGAGGRLAVEYTAPQTNAFAGAMSAYGGNGTTRGGAGTIWLSPYNQPQQLVVDNGGVVGANTPIPSYGSFGLSLREGATTVLTVPQTFSSLLVGSNDTLIFGYSFLSDVTINGDATIEQGGRLLADGWGNAANYGTSPGRYCYSNGYAVLYGGGGGYGGAGGPGAYACAAGGASFGLASQANSLGSGGGDTGGGSYGGGRVGLKVTGNLAVRGTISANGTAGIWPGSGGGSGGSIALTVGMLTGAGCISANGGNGDPARGGGGGGGRIALAYSTNLYTGILCATGGSGWSSGGAGTVYTKANLTIPTLTPMLSKGLDATNLWLSWPGIQGLTYQALWSTNLSDWLPLGSAFPGSNGLMEVVAPVTTVPQSFFRLKATN